MTDGIGPNLIKQNQNQATKRVTGNIYKHPYSIAKIGRTYDKSTNDDIWTHTVNNAY